jgi:peptidoglycan hydrolase CwlO-like protein
MVADDGSNIYEIALPEYDYYFGEMPSGNHAILMTTTVSFTSKGWFTINARRLTDVPIQLNQEFGGFTQNWPVYQEVTDSDVADQNAKIQQLSDLNGQINDLQQQKASIDEKNADLHEDIKEQIGSMT